MEKYGVDEGDSKDKTAEDTSAPTCPRCHTKLETHGNVKLCPNCGSSPFEQGEEKENT